MDVPSGCANSSKAGICLQNNMDLCQHTDSHPLGSVSLVVGRLLVEGPRPQLRSVCREQLVYQMLVASGVGGLREKRGRGGKEGREREA